jgi:hypothetical protein
VRRAGIPVAVPATAKRAGVVVTLLVLLAVTSPALAQSIDVTATLDITGGLARPGAYVPVRFKVVNGTTDLLSEISIRNSSPVEIRVPWEIDPGATDEAIIPVFYAGGDFDLAVEFTVSGSARRIRAALQPPAVRAPVSGSAIVAVISCVTDPDEGLQKKIAEVLGAKSVQLVRIPEEHSQFTWSCGLADAVVTGYGDIRTQARAPTFVFVDASASEHSMQHAPSPSGVLEAVQPHAYSLFGQDVWSEAERRRLWIGLGMFGLAVLTVGVLAAKMRPGRAVGLLIALALAASYLFWCFGDLRLARIREARVYYEQWASFSYVLERLVQLESRGGETARYGCGYISGGYWAQPPTIDSDAFPIPVLASSQDMFRSQCILAPKPDYASGRMNRFSVRRILELPPLSWIMDLTSRGPRCQLVSRDFNLEIQTHEAQLLIHQMIKEDTPFDVVPASLDVTELERVSLRTGLVKALLVEGDRATDAAGKTQPVDAWAVEWQADKDPDVAFVGRSLAWWKKDRQEGDGPWILAWWHDPLPAQEQGKGHERLPALVVYSAATKQQ